jgi:iron(III) transport system ATP-binding protein
MLTLHDVSLNHGATAVVQQVSLSLAVGELACLLGPSGCGKTTLLRAVAGLHPLRSGRIELRGECVDGPNVRRPTEQRRIGMVFQDLALFPHLDVQQHLQLALHAWPSAERAPRVQQLLEDFQLVELLKRRPHQLSGGQQQRVALARALAARTDLVLLDEPFSSLDARLKAQMNRWLRQQLKRYGASALMVSHDQQEALVFADRIGVMHAGCLLQWGTPREVYSQPNDRRVAEFVGESQLLHAQRIAVGRYRSVLGEFDLNSELVEGWLLLRPEDLQLDSAAAVQGRVIHGEFRGSWTCYRVRLLDTETEVWAAANAHPSLGDGSMTGVSLRPGRAQLLPLDQAPTG